MMASQKERTVPLEEYESLQQDSEAQGEEIAALKAQIGQLEKNVPVSEEEVKQDFEGRSPSITARLKAISNLRYNIPYKSAGFPLRCLSTLAGR